METLEIHLIEFSSKCHTILVLKPICHAAIGSALQHLKQRRLQPLAWSDVKSNQTVILEEVHTASSVLTRVHVLT